MEQQECISDDPTQLHNKDSHRYINNEPTKRERERERERGYNIKDNSADCTVMTVGCDALQPQTS